MQKNQSETPNIPPLEPLIMAVCGHRVILDADLARLYGVTTKAVNQALKRNINRFPSDFAFQLIPDEAASLNWSQICDSISEGNSKTPRSSFFAVGFYRTRRPHGRQHLEKR